MLMLGKYIGTLNTLSTEKTKLLPLTAYNRVRPSNDNKKKSGCNQLNQNVSVK